jgi:hypothetical protein
MIAIGLLKEIEGKCPFHDREDKKCPDGVENKLTGDADLLGKNLHSGSVSTVNNSLKECEPYKSLLSSKEEDPEDESVFTEYDGTDLDRFVNIFDDPINRPHAEYPVGFQAHHLIPAAESLEPCTELLKFIEKERNIIRCDLGYNVNGAENGVWLPGKHPVQAPGKDPVDPSKAPLDLWSSSSSGTKKDNEPGTRKTIIRCKDLYEPLKGSKRSKPWDKENLKWLYVLKSMTFFSKTDKKKQEHQGPRQFHERHYKYSTIVRQSLDTFASHLRAKSGITLQVSVTCGKCKEKMDQKKKLPPPYPLLGRLNSLSAHYRTILFSKDNARIFTSSWCDSELKQSKQK